MCGISTIIAIFLLFSTVLKRLFLKIKWKGQKRAKSKKLSRHFAKEDKQMAKITWKDAQCCCSLRKIHIKTTIGYYTPTGMAEINSDSISARRYRATRTLTHCWWESKWYTLENNLAVSFNGCMNKQTMLHPYGIFLKSHTKYWTIKRQQVLVKIWRNWNLFTLLMEMQNVSVTKENSVEVLQKLKMESLCDLAIPLLSICPKELKSEILTPEILAPLCSLKHHLQ